ncbi:MAG: hypothetical protein JWM34_1642 [Ilumatobacteraceae bacterium]|nr:hypothetical protein [Ilumatobacteraceae bacterium]
MRCRSCAVVVVVFSLLSSLGFAAHAMAEGPPAGSAALPFDMPASATLQGSARKVFAHYMTAFPLSIDNQPAATDYYTEGYLDPAGESSKHASSGGFIRERPLPIATSASAAWSLANMETEVARASAAGIDGFTVDILGLSGYIWDRVGLMMQAARAVDPNFKILIMPDVASGVAADSNALASAVSTLAANPAAYRLADGRLVISPFYAEGKSADWWKQWIATMQTSYGIAVAFVPTFLDYGNAAAFSSISYGMSTWGSRNPGSIQGSVADANDAHARGKIWMQPVALQDERPYAGVFDEANNTETLRGLWNIAIGQSAEWVQLVTWNDYSEGSEISPSTHIGWSPLDLIAYDITRYKIGVAPTIVRDVLYVSHRVQLAAAKPSGPQTMLMTLRPGTTPPRDLVEVQAFLRNAGVVSVTVGGSHYAYNAPAGRSIADFPLETGTVSASMAYPDGTALQVVSPFPVVAHPVVQDLSYYFASSGRSGQIVTAGAPATINSPPAALVVPPSASGASGIVQIAPVHSPNNAPAAVALTPVLDASALASPGGFTSVAPVRVVDTRQGLGGQRLAQGEVRRVQVGGAAQVPNGATAVSANITSVTPATAGFVSAYRCGDPVPAISTVNFSIQADTANAAIVPLDATGGFCVLASTGVDLVVDINGYVDAASTGRLVPTAPRRVIDTRTPADSSQRLVAGEPTEIDMSNDSTGVPADATAVAINVTAVGAAAATFVTVYPCEQNVPVVSTLNVTDAAPESNSAIVSLSGTGTICFYSLRDVDLVVDLSGYMVDGPGLRFTPLSATRLVDTRDPQPALNLGSGGAQMPDGSTSTLQLAGTRGIPASAVVVSLNVTTTATTGAGYVTVWPCATKRPVVSSLNAMQGSSTSAAVTGALSAKGTLCLFAQPATHVIVDINGFWAP